MVMKPMGWDSNQLKKITQQKTKNKPKDFSRNPGCQRLHHFFTYPSGTHSMEGFQNQLITACLKSNWQVKQLKMDGLYYIIYLDLLDM